MVEAERTFTVRTPQPVVFAYLRDWGNSREWDPGTITSEQLTDGPVAVGTQWRNVLRLLRRRVVVDFTLDDDTDDRLVFSGWNRTALSVDTITCTPTDDGGTSIHYESTIEFRRIARLFAPLLAWQFERIGDRLAQKMRVALDRQA